MIYNTRFILSCLFLCLLTGVASAQNNTTNVNPPKSASVASSLTLNAFIEITKSSLNASPFSFDTFSAYQNGVTRTSFVGIGVKSTENWIVSLRGNTTHFAASNGGAANSMPASVLSFKRKDQTTFTPLSSTAQTLSTGTSGGTSQTGNSFEVDLRANPGFNYPSGIYTMDLIFTITQQ